MSLTGLRIGPIDPATKAAKVGLKNEIVRPEHSMASLQPRIMKVSLGISNFRNEQVSREVSKSLKTTERARKRKRAFCMTKIRRRIWKLPNKVR